MIFNYSEQTDVSLLSLEKETLMKVENTSPVPHLYFSWQWVYQGPHMQRWAQSPVWWPCRAPLVVHQFPLLLPRIQNRASEHHGKPHQNQEKMPQRASCPQGSLGEISTVLFPKFIESFSQQENKRNILGKTIFSNIKSLLKTKYQSNSKNIPNVVKHWKAFCFSQRVRLYVFKTGTSKTGAQRFYAKECVSWETHGNPALKFTVCQHPGWSITRGTKHPTLLFTIMVKHTHSATKI